jgi:Uncharacterized protein conserved in bacteria
MTARRLFCLAVLLSTVVLDAAAQGYPARPIHFIVPYPAGGPLDTVARLLGAKLPSR